MLIKKLLGHVHDITINLITLFISSATRALIFVSNTSISKELCQFSWGSCIYWLKISTSVVNCNILSGHHHDITIQLLGYISLSRQSLVYFVSNISIFSQLCPYTSKSCIHRLTISISVVNLNILLSHPHDIMTHFQRYLSLSRQLLVGFVTNISIFNSYPYTSGSCLYRLRICLSDVNFNILLCH